MGDDRYATGWTDQIPGAGAPYRPSVSTGFPGFGAIFRFFIPERFQPSFIQREGFVANIFYLSVLIFMLFIILIVIHFTIFPIFSLSPNDDGLISVPTMSDEQTVFDKTLAIPDLSANFVNVEPFSYTIGMDLYLNGIFTPSNTPRVILYRSISKVSTTSGDTAANILTRFPDTNIIIWLDPIKNDLYVSLLTSSDGTAVGASLETIPPIENIPIKRVFRLTCVLSQQFIELYINGNLERSMTFKKTLVSVSANKIFYLTPARVSPSVLASTVSFWPRILKSREVRSFGQPKTEEKLYKLTM